MARKTRISLPNIPQHIIKKSLNEKIIFHDKEDYTKFSEFMFISAEKLDVKIYSYIFMEKYFELLISSHISENISKFMQTLGRNYVFYYNKKYNRSGTIWEGRYKTSLVEVEYYAEKVSLYIDNIAIKNNLVNTISSSLKKKKKISLSDFDKKFIEKSLQSETITGSDSFIKSLENIVGKTLVSKKRGRPKNTNIQGNKMYKKLELLSKEKHSNLKIKPLSNLLFAKNMASIPVLISETEKIMTTFPIVFTADENPSLIAITALGNDNLAITEDGRWITNYIPAVYRKYPFTYVNVKENTEQKAVAIDIEAEIISTDVGNTLFDEDKEQTQLLKDTIQFLTSYEQETMKTKSLVKIIADANILEDREISVGEGAEKKVLVKGFKVVDREKLNALDDATLASWVRNGIISFINLHIKSLDNMQTLMDLSSQKNS
ncbi:SapC family protein [Poseidonibacter lekithochrous]|uniref:SapC family protein n=1 Tax=Poseidonibacter TaxID=2321187 RepID=UPI001C08EC33|nr:MULTISPECIES: SapC family protein [Poseidonibacter]MBU3014248.1 SapC family protein [Poseidonibacter lekithochrous]MDO6827545.1 SapC family protein [Poseidonibacter sp. 1_MG-2023]